MSAKNFYHTLYQTDSIYRLPNESWAVSSQVLEEPAVADKAIYLHLEEANTSDLLTELDALTANSVKVIEPVVADITQVPPVLITPVPEPVVLIHTPEPLPEPAPRPTTPAIVPPIQQARLPQLNHKVLLLADEELDPSNLLFLEKILKAVNLNIEGVDLLNLHGVRDMDFPELLRGKYINHFITFGVPFERINLDIMMDRYSPVRFEGITFLMADSLPTIEADQNLKKRLWGALQRIFLQR
ncbi:hypothetical protein EXU85_12730 [Spirosoma sp. KCTC 42546]|uniref:hypothetical protein n=1 Tax=Spirosoma sp. KCTC 42546 TaxID=2520506 RepID=UPI0011571A30|nr:hypothetical protein [Spirosoma sp. KCTC 42546]QDK79421.1 hypothetical protein EXU85_12730 [Spirosoma sp. KCTC 42546]